ncbi:MAG: hypothetical protein IT521_05515 [Burkholderiales bacterium]|nr:hypothetical protein [Burkholderiales bacterium]
MIRYWPGRCLLSAMLACMLAVAEAAVGGAEATRPLGVATWNLNWLLGADSHARWVVACSRNAWPADTRATLAGLPYCNVHNGMTYPPERCRTARDGWPDAQRYPDDHPCRDTADLASWPRYVQKVAALKAMFRRLHDQGVGLVALQEVFDATAVRAILPPGWSVTTTRELSSAPAIAQHVGVAWRRGVKARDFAAVDTLADSGRAQHPLRPGLAFTVDVGGAPVRVLVVHLKAGCRSRDLDVPAAADGAREMSRREAALASDCATLRYQLPALEDWIDANAHVDFAVLGDFNRTLLREAIADTAGHTTRVDGSAAGDPVGPCTLASDGGRLQARCPARTRAIFPEINDTQPAGAVIWRARFADLGRGGTIRKGSSGDCSIAGPHGDLGHDGIDHVLIGESLKRRLGAGALTMRVVNYLDDDGSPLRAQPDRALPSDHCPHVVKWAPVRSP